MSQLVATIKATSLGYIIGLSEVSFIATQVNTLVFTKAVEVYIVLALTYFILVLRPVAPGLPARAPLEPAPGTLKSFRHDPA